MRKKPSAERQGIPPSEWAVATIGAALVLASIVILVHSGLTSHDAPPRLSIRVAAIQPAGERFLVVIEVNNEGGSTAADARIEAELRQHGEIVEQREITVDFVPPKSKRRAGLFFTRDPRAIELTMRASGYREP
jgi:uncharacterized protein (TIGR02588 family)